MPKSHRWNGVLVPLRVSLSCWIRMMLLCSIPGRGEAPTTSWVEGEVLIDGYEIEVDPDAPLGEYVIEIGMYDANTGERLLVYETPEEPVRDRILLGRVEVVKRP